MSHISYARRAIERRSLTIDRVFPPDQFQENIAVFGGDEIERVEVMIRGIQRSINRQAIIVLHNSVAMYNALTHYFHPVNHIDISSRSFDPLVGVMREDALEVRRILYNAIRTRGIVSIRTPSTDTALQRMLFSELQGLIQAGQPFQLVLFEVSHNADVRLFDLVLGEHHGMYSSAIGGSSIARTVTFDCLAEILHSSDAVVILPLRDMVEAEQLSGHFGRYMRSYSQRSEHTHGIWPFKHRSSGTSQQQAPTNNIDPAKLMNHSIVCGSGFQEPILVSNLIL